MPNSSESATPTVVVTGLGATTPVGGDVASTWEGLLAGRSGVRSLTQEWASELPVTFAARPQSTRATYSTESRPASSTARNSSHLSPPARLGQTPGTPEVDPERLGSQHRHRNRRCTHPARPVGRSTASPARDESVRTRSRCSCPTGRQPSSDWSSRHAPVSTRRSPHVPLVPRRWRKACR